MGEVLKANGWGLIAETMRSVTRYTRNNCMSVVMFGVVKAKCGKGFEHEVTEELEDNVIRQQQYKQPTERNEYRAS